MEIIRGKHASFIDSAALADVLAGYHSIHLDIGTGDGRFVQHIAQTQPRTFAIGIDACRENLHEVSRRVPDNALFVIANAQALPPELHNMASHITINFPWGSLMDGLLSGESVLLDGLQNIARPGASLEIRLNGGAVREAGWSLEAGAQRVHEVLAQNGFSVRAPTLMAANELRAFPTTWAKRLAFGRDPRAYSLRAVRWTEARRDVTESISMAVPV